MSRKTSVVRAGLTSVAGLVGIGVSGAVVLALCVIPFPVLAGTPASMLVDPTASTAVRVCPGPLLSVQTRDGDATSFVGFQSPDIVSASSDDAVQERYLKVADAANENGTLAPVALSVEPPADASIPLITGVQSQSAVTDEMAGLAVTPCVEPEAESWLVGGATDLGQTTVVNLSNASTTDASVRIEVYGERGRIDPTGSNDVVVQAGTQSIVSLAALAPGLAAPVVRVTSSGGAIAASLQQTLVRTIVPSGLEIIEPGSGPNTTQIIAGVQLTGMAQFSDSEGGTVSTDEEPTVRVLATSAEPSDVVVTTIAEDGTTTEVKSTVPAGVVLQLPFNAVSDGTYSVVVTGTTPVVAAVRSVVGANASPFTERTIAPTSSSTPGASTAPGPSTAPSPESPPSDAILPAPQPNPFDTITGGDFAWYASTSSLSATTLVAVAATESALLTLFNAGEETQSVSLSSDAAPDESISLEPGRFAVVSVVPGNVYQIDGALGIRAGVAYGGIGVVSATTVRAPSKLGSAIMVYPR
ncbi:MAG: DUF5719 family protein [Actinobacteria bacterium]|nr:DUF5719 family protein [Actinomycetota bacterium]